MPAPAWENLDDFLSVEDFAVTGLVTLADATTVEVVGIFDDPYLDAQLGEYDMDTSKPRFVGKETDFSGVQRGDTIDIEGQVYDIMTGPQPDGTGMATIELEKV